MKRKIVPSENIESTTNIVGLGKKIEDLKEKIDNLKMEIEADQAVIDDYEGGIPELELTEDEFKEIKERKNKAEIERNKLLDEYFHHKGKEHQVFDSPAMLN